MSEPSAFERRTEGEHPVRLLVTDDLQRSRLTVFFRLILSIPHFIWLTLWGIATLVLAIVNWLCTLVTGRPPRRLHRVLAAYVKYGTQFHAYLHLAAEPYPRFDGAAGYAIDVTLPGPQRQNRWSVLFRGLLLLPSVLIVQTLVGFSVRYASARPGSFLSSQAFSTASGLAGIVALLGWFAALAVGRMPRGLRDAAAYGLCYGAQFWAYAFVLTDRYPDSDPLAAVPGLPRRSDAIHLELADDLRRSRLTVFFRFLLALPHLIWLELWGIVVLLCVILDWFATLVTGRSPQWLHRFLAAYVRYSMHVYAFLYLIANPFPGFVGKAGSYPFEIVVAPRERQNRWKTGFRIVLVLPAFLLLSVYGGLASIVALLGWFSSLARGRMPQGLRNAGALALRYQAQTIGYLLLLTDAYPYSGPVRSVDESGEDAAAGSGGLDAPHATGVPAATDGPAGPGASAAPDRPAAPRPSAAPDIGLS